MQNQQMRSKKIKIKGVTKKTQFDYKNVELLKNFISSSGRILPRSRTGLTAKQQRQLTKAIKRARILALLPFTVKE